MKVSLRLKWTAVVLGAALTPLLATAYANLRIQERGLARAEADLQVAVVDDVASSVFRTLDSAATAAVATSEILTDGRIADDDARLDLARSRIGSTPSLAYVAIYSPDGALIDSIARVGADPHPPAKLDVPDAPKWIDGPAYLVPMVREGERRGLAYAAIDLAALSREIALLSVARFHAEDRVFIVGRDYKVVVGPTTGPFAIGQSLAGKDLFASQVQTGDTFWTSYAAFTKYDVGGEAMVGTTRTLPDRGWAIVVRRPEREAFAELGDSRRAFSWTAFAAVLVAAVIGVWLAMRTIRPVRALVQLSRQIGQRHFEARAKVTTGDELETLGDSMNAMAGELAASEVEIARRARVEAALSRYMPDEIARRIAAGEASAPDIAGSRRKIAVLFADIAGFTPFAESAPAEQVAALLNELFALLTEIVFRHNGIVDKFIGDCVMAIFSEGEVAENALAAAEDMHRFVEAAAEKWKERFGIDVKLGIGIASGEALVGNLGSERRVEFTAIGDVVNVAARLETLAHPGQTLCTVDVAGAGATDFAFETLGKQAIRGKKALVEVFQVAP